MASGVMAISNLSSNILFVLPTGVLNRVFASLTKHIADQGNQDSTHD